MTRLAPGGSSVSWRSLQRLVRETQPEAKLREGLLERFDDRPISLHRSGREALRVAFLHLAATSGRREVVIPAYGCFSIPAAAVAAGLEVRLVDVDLTGRIDTEALKRLPLERVAALVIHNLFGVPEPIRDIEALTSEAQIRLVDDAAQTLGARSEAGAVGGRGEIGVLSFGRGKPLSALGGGALVWSESTHTATAEAAVERVTCEPPQRARALLRAAAYDIARLPVVLRGLSAIPALGIGTTDYDPDFARGPMSGAAVALAAALLPELDAANRARARCAEALATRIAEETDFIPLLAQPGETGIYPRLGVVAASARQRDKALAALTAIGVTAMYPTPIAEIDALRPHLVGDRQCPGAEAFCARLLTIPTHSGLRKRHLDRLIGVLRNLRATS